MLQKIRSDRLSSIFSIARTLCGFLRRFSGGWPSEPSTFQQPLQVKFHENFGTELLTHLGYPLSMRVIDSLLAAQSREFACCLAAC